MYVASVAFLCLPVYNYIMKIAAMFGLWIGLDTMICIIAVIMIRIWLIRHLIFKETIALVN